MLTLQFVFFAVIPNARFGVRNLYLLSGRERSPYETCRASSLLLTQTAREHPFRNDGRNKAARLLVHRLVL